VKLEEAKKDEESLIREFEEHKKLNIKENRRSFSIETTGGGSRKER